MAVRGLPPTDRARSALNATFERALATLHKMPRIWEMYLACASGQGKITLARRAFDRALRALPVTQHGRIWPAYLAFVRQDGVPVATALRVYRRYMKLEPTRAEEFISFLRSKGHWNECAERLTAVLNDDAFVSVEGKSKQMLWVELCELITRHPGEITSIPVERILRVGIGTFESEVGRLWTALGDYFIRKAMFEKARDVFEEGMASVATVRDFSVIFDAYTQFEESLLTAKMEEEEEEAEGAGEAGAPGAGADEDDGAGFMTAPGGEVDVDMRLARLEHLIERRPELLSSVVLRQNPHNVHEWLKRVKVFSKNAGKQVVTFTQAVKTVDAERAVGKVSLLWAAFAKFYEAHGDVANARLIFEKAVNARFRTVDDLAAVWCEWAEMELRHKEHDRARRVMRRATSAGPADAAPAGGGRPPAQARLHRCLRVWALHVDLEESLGSLEEARGAYDRMIELKIASPQTVLNYALLLRENKYFEDSFRVYERAVASFRFPHVKEIWSAYLTHFIERYGDRKLERARDLFESALGAFPAAEQAALFLRYAALEETFGLARRAMQVYARAAAAVPGDQRLGVFEAWVASATKFYGFAKTREIYGAALEAGMSARDTLACSLRFAQLERKLGEIDRARAIYTHGSQFADPKRQRAFWAEWNEFEVTHGNEDTFREMLRVKRSVQDMFGMTFYAGLAGAGGGGAQHAADRTGPDRPGAGGEPAGQGVAESSMAMLERQALAAAAAAGAPEEAPAGVGAGTGLSGFVSAGVVGDDRKDDEPVKDADEIDIDC